MLKAPSAKNLLNKLGRELQDELNLNVGTLKRLKNVISDETELMNLLDELKGS